MANKGDKMNRKMLKSIIESVLGPGEQIELIDVGPRTTLSANELTDISRKAIKDVYKRAVIASPAVAAGAQRAGKSMAKSGYENTFSEIDRYAVLVTNTTIRMIPVETQSKAFGVEYVPRDDLDTFTVARDKTGIELGAEEESKLYGQKYRTIEVLIHVEGMEPVVLKMANVDGWRALAEA
jgi:hypothetical protein